MIETASTAKSSLAAQSNARSHAPVFVVGCPRSGTTLLYHMLLSAGDFAIYRTESSVFNLLEPRFGNLSVAGNKKRLLEAWFGSKLFIASGLDREEITGKVMSGCRNGGDFLRIVMSEMARKQGVRRWADTTPEHLLYLKHIKETIPGALVIHMIRDGRDAALSMDKLGYVRRLWWDRTPSKMAAGIYWQWMVSKGRRDGVALGDDYLEVHFEHLIREPRTTLGQVGKFIGQNLDYDQIRRVGIGSVRAPNTSFEHGGTFNPVGRWRDGFSQGELATFEGLVGTTLVENGYELATVDKLPRRAGLNMMRTAYARYFDTKLFVKTKTPLGRLLVTRDLSWV